MLGSSCPSHGSPVRQPVLILNTVVAVPLLQHTLFRGFPATPDTTRAYEVPKGAKHQTRLLSQHAARKKTQNRELIKFLPAPVVQSARLKPGPAACRPQR